ncbi:MAG: 3-oxoacyl-ACP synthase, partial [Clostridiales bacterium]|nr:3-oxoacyl-ACP synthase [Clostridiales bacterium]
MTGKICGTGACVPERVVTNDDLSKLVETSDEWIRERTGIRNRHIISGEETTVTLAAQAGRRALENAGITAEEVDMILLSSISSNLILPCGACAVQGLLGASRAVCFD